jgi:hypothetical protein
LSWWLLLVLVLYGIRLHQRLSAQTNGQFTASVPGQSAFQPASAQLDGQPFSSGERVAIGRHQMVFMHPKEDHSRPIYLSGMAHRIWGN